MEQLDLFDFVDINKSSRQYVWLNCPNMVDDFVVCNDYQFNGVDFNCANTCLGCVHEDECREAFKHFVPFRR